MSYSYVRRASGESYLAWLQGHDWKLSPMEAAHQKQLSTVAQSVEKGLNDIIKRFGSTASFEHGGRFTKEQLDKLIEARKVLEGVLVPMGMVKIVRDEDDEPID